MSALKPIFRTPSSTKPRMFGLGWVEILNHVGKALLGIRKTFYQQVDSVHLSLSQLRQKASKSSMATTVSPRCLILASKAASLSTLGSVFQPSCDKRRLTSLPLSQPVARGLGKVHLPNIGDDLNADVGQTMKLFTRPTSYELEGGNLRTLPICSNPDSHKQISCATLNKSHQSDTNPN
jgi:hypothetical protein